MNAPEQTTKAWVALSAWSLAPTLFFLTLLLAFFWTTLAVFVTGGDSSAILLFLLPVAAFLSHQMGKKCVLDLGARAPRKRLWGAAALLGLIYAGFSFLLLHNSMEEILADPALSERFFSQLTQDFAINQEDLSALQDPQSRDVLLLLNSLIVGALFFLLHGAFLSWGARSIERLLPSLKK